MSMRLGRMETWLSCFPPKRPVLTSLTDLHPCVFLSGPCRSHCYEMGRLSCSQDETAQNGRICWLFETCQGWLLLEVYSEHWHFLCVLLSPLPLLFALPSCYLLLVSEKGQKGDRCIWAGLATLEAVSSADTRRLWQSSRWGGFCWAFAFLSWVVMLVAVLGAPWQWVAVNVPGMKRGCPSPPTLTLTFQKSMLTHS